MPEVTTCVRCQDRLERSKRLQPVGGPVRGEDEDE
jgi:RNA polymerase-binding transcription factor DksA